MGSTSEVTSRFTVDRAALRHSTNRGASYFCVLDVFYSTSEVTKSYSSGLSLTVGRALTRFGRIESRMLLKTVVPVPTGTLLLVASSDISPRSVGPVTPQESSFEPDSSSVYLNPTATAT